MICSYGTQGYVGFRIKGLGCRATAITWVYRNNGGFLIVVNLN